MFIAYPSNGVDGLIAHWSESELTRIGNCFESISAHNSAFFLLAVEESRESIWDDSSPEALSRRGDADVIGRKNGLSIWRECEVTGIISESEYGGLPRGHDPRLGSVWIVSVSIIQKQNFENDNSQNPPSLYGGDLLLLQR